MPEGVGGHLFAIAADKSLELGHGGAIYAFAANEELLKHYMDKFGGVYIGTMHRYHFWIPEDKAKELLEVYHYEWN